MPAGYSNHVISDRNYRKPETYGEILHILAEEGIISRGLMDKLEGMAAFRNLLVHDYLRVDHERVYKALNDNLKYFEELAAVYAELL